MKLNPSLVVLISALLLTTSLVSVEGDKNKKGRKPNPLVKEKSPYLLQHAYNPVYWYPWGEEAFKLSKESGKPIFLSIGYSTCHWCHVMERESFEDKEIAEYLNKHFICIKVDREERPDVDEVYMRALIAYKRSGGWPLSAFLTPEGKPFFLGSYFPPRDHPQRGTGFMTLIQRVVELWGGEKKKELEAFSEQFTKQLQAGGGPKPSEKSWSRELSNLTFTDIERAFDPVHGGFAGPRHRPKFPRTSNLDFLLAYHHTQQDKKSLDMAELTLQKMADGGIYDHVGKGFARYSVDRIWLVPHFEKMLYDNALLVKSYVDAYRITGKKRYLNVAKGCLEYLMGRMQHSDGGFYSAEDADSEGVEGKFYVFKQKELLELLGKEAGELYCERYGVTDFGNFEHKGDSILFLKTSLDELAKKHQKTVSEIEKQLEESRLKVLAYRNKRIPPLKDDKILTDWNGFALTALSLAYQATGEKSYLDAAERAQAFIDLNLKKEGKLFHRWRLGEARHLAYFEDHAFLAEGYLDLYEASLDLTYLVEAKELTLKMIHEFWDPKQGAFFQSSKDHEKLIIKTKDFYDGAIPSGNSVAANLLTRLSHYTGDSNFKLKLAELGKYGDTLIRQNARSYPQMALAGLRSLTKRRDFIVYGNKEEALTQEFIREIQKAYIPSKVILQVEAKNRDQVSSVVPWLKEIKALQGKKESPPHVLIRLEGGEWKQVGSVKELKAELKKR